MTTVRGRLGSGSERRIPLWAVFSTTEPDGGTSSASRHPRAAARAGRVLQGTVHSTVRTNVGGRLCRRRASRDRRRSLHSVTSLVCSPTRRATSSGNALSSTSTGCSTPSTRMRRVPTFTRDRTSDAASLEATPRRRRRCGLRDLLGTPSSHRHPPDDTRAGRERQSVPSMTSRSSPPHQLSSSYEGAPGTGSESRTCRFKTT